MGDLNLTPGEMAVMRLVSQWGKAATPPANMPTDLSIENRTPPLTQVNAMDGIPMLTRLADLLTRYPPHANDYPILLRLRALGPRAGQTVLSRCCATNAKCRVSGIVRLLRPRSAMCSSPKREAHASFGLT